MSKYRNGEIWGFEREIDNSSRSGEVVLGVDGGATSTVCVCMPYVLDAEIDVELESLPVISRAVAGCSNHNSVGEAAARGTLEQVIAEALLKSGSSRGDVRAICLGVSGVNEPKDQERILNWLRHIFPGLVNLYVYNDAVAALASGTMGKLHGCVLISGTGSISYGLTEDGDEVRAGGGGPVLGDWGSGYGIAAQALTAILRAHDGRGPETMLSTSILQALGLSSPDNIIGWTYADSSWARIAALGPVVVSCAEAGDEIANKILVEAVEELAACVKAVVKKLHLGGDGSCSFPIVMVGGVLQANKKWDIENEIMRRIWQAYPNAFSIRPKVEPAVGAALVARNLLLKESKTKPASNKKSSKDGLNSSPVTVFKDRAAAQISLCPRTLAGN
ncbi:N-acetyl-D-glucosamine kinase-like protein [Drosera capensis]